MNLPPDPNPPPPIASGPRPRLVCFANDVFGNVMSGGDVYFYFMVRAALEAGYSTHFFGGHAFRHYLEKRELPLNLTLTDSGPGNLGDVSKLSGQLRLLWDFGRRFAGTLPRLGEIKPDDVAYTMSEYWFDVIPLILSRARNKIIYLGMMAPTLKQVLLKQRPDVTSIRLPSLYYWMSQQLSLRWFRHCPGGIVTYSHPEMRDYLLKFGYRESGLWYVPNGSDVMMADQVPEQPKKFDVAWTGRVHPQKGIDDLLATLAWLKQRLPDFRAVIIGKSRDALQPVVNQMGLADHVTFSGLVSEEEKFRLLKSSRLFLMPSRYESWGIVVGEALVSGTPVVAYKLSCYPEVFGNFVRYVNPFDCEEFKRTAEAEVRLQRQGLNYLRSLDWAGLKRRLSWSAAQKNFCQLLNRIAGSRNTESGGFC